MPLLADLHNHSCLSPCGSLDLSPTALAHTAARKGIRLLALTDHNSALNGPAFLAACQREGIVPLFGMEACTFEEVHILCLFPWLEQALAFGEDVRTLLPPIPNDPESMGDQVIVDVDEGIEGEAEYWLGSALDLGVDDIGARVAGFGGFCIPAHVDRPAFSMTSQLGFIPDGPWAALECVRLPPEVPTAFWPLTTSSDAHYLEHVGRRPFELDIEEALLRDLGLGGWQLPSGSAADAAREALLEALSRRPCAQGPAKGN